MKNTYEELIKKFPPSKNVLGVDCWTPSRTADAVGLHKNTILNWARKTKKEEMDMPLRGGKTKHSKIFIPIAEFIDWYEFA